VWTPEVPTYFFVGGLAGACAPLTLLASLRGNDVLARRAAGLALAGAVISPALLISDLGRPARFLNMLRLFKVTSPMSVGSWILTGFGAAAAASAARELLGVVPRIGRAAQAAEVLLGPLLSTYTGALIAQTAVPVWHEARRELPFVFAAGSLASAGSALQLLTPFERAAPARRMAIAGAAAELVAVRAMERRLGELAEPYERGRIGAVARCAKALTAAGGGLVGVANAPVDRGRGVRPALFHRRRTVRKHVALAKPGGALILAGAALERWAIFRAGFASSADPKYVTGPQRARMGTDP
jgi:formate-dependent nitrite reductase membrane component NrfD